MSQDRGIRAMSPRIECGASSARSARKRTPAQAYRRPEPDEFLPHQAPGAFGAVVATILVLVAVFANVLDTHDPYQIRPEDASGNKVDVFASPDPQFWLGTDHLGRDVYSRLVHRRENIPCTWVCSVPSLDAPSGWL